MCPNLGTPNMVFVLLAAVETKVKRVPPKNTRIYMAYVIYIIMYIYIYTCTIL